MAFPSHGANLNKFKLLRKCAQSRDVTFWIPFLGYIYIYI